MAKELQGRVALVTGAGRNIGRAIAVALADAGASVAVNARKSQDEIQSVASQINGLAMLADVSDPQAVERMVQAVLAKFGRLDILVNCAAVRAVEPIESIDANRWREVTSVVLDGAWFCARASLDALKKSGAGAIVNIGGLSAHTGAVGRPRHRLREGEVRHVRHPARANLKPFGNEEVAPLASRVTSGATRTRLPDAGAGSKRSEEK